jgi:hypothetical protein
MHRITDREALALTRKRLALWKAKRAKEQALLNYERTEEALAAQLRAIIARMEAHWETQPERWQEGVEGRLFRAWWRHWERQLVARPLDPVLVAELAWGWGAELPREK